MTTSLTEVRCSRLLEIPSILFLTATLMKGPSEGLSTACRCVIRTAAVKAIRSQSPVQRIGAAHWRSVRLVFVAGS